MRLLPLLVLFVALQACADLPTPAEPTTGVRITLDLPSTVPLGEGAWLHAVVRDLDGSRILAPRLAWEIEQSWEEPLQIVSEHADSVRVLGADIGTATVRVFLERHRFLVSDTATGQVRVGYRNVEVSFPGLDPVLHVPTLGVLEIPIRAVDARGDVLEVWRRVQVQVKPGTALVGDSWTSSDRVGWHSVAPGTDTLIASVPDCLETCENRLIVKVEPVPVSIGFPQPGAFLYMSSLGDSLRPAAVLLDAEGFQLGDADPVYTFADPADSVVLDPAALAEGILVSRSTGDVGIQARDGDATGEALVFARQHAYQFEVLDPVARYLVGPGAGDTTRIEIRDRRGNLLISPPERDPRFNIQWPDIVELERVGRTVAIFRAMAYGETLVWTSLTQGCWEINCPSVGITNAIRVIPEPDSVRALDPPVDPVPYLGLVPDRMLGDIHLPGETLRAAELVWTALDPAVATVDPWGRATTLSNGTARFEGRMGMAADTVMLTVSAPGG